MYIIGLTGGIASGKSTVSKMLTDFGAVVLDADKVAHAVMQPDTPAWSDIVTTFGKSVLSADRTVNRGELGNRIFSDTAGRKQLEAILHPRIQQYFQMKIAEHERAGTAVLVLDVPLLYEAGWQDMADEVWVVYVDCPTQLLRLMARSKLTAEQAAIRINAQLDLQEKARLADIVIDNNSDIQNTRRQVQSRWEQVLKLN